MKKTKLYLLRALCAVLMVASLGLTACGSSSASASGTSGASDTDMESVALLAQRALDAQAIQNVMSWHVMYHCYGEHQAEMENIWVQEPENQATASFGQNQGMYVGYGSIWDAYVEGHTSSWLQTAKNYCETNGIDITGWTDEEILEVYGGVGQLLLHVTTTAIIEVAEDGQTAKAFWYSPGMICETGQTGNTIWEAYGADFVKEGDTWKLWHLHMFTDFMGGYYLTLGQSMGGGPGGGGSSSGDASADSSQQTWEGEGGSQLAKSGQLETSDNPDIDDSTRHEYVSSTEYTEFSKNRLRSEMEIFLPVQYSTWSFDDGNYGPTVEQYESLGIDLDAWYAAH